MVTYVRSQLRKSALREGMDCGKNAGQVREKVANNIIKILGFLVLGKFGLGFFVSVLTF